MKMGVKMAIKKAVMNIKAIETTGMFLTLSYYIAHDFVHIPIRMASAIGFSRD
jgi:hypothetical protein